jgi:ribonuclease-3
MTDATEPPPGPAAEKAPTPDSAVAALEARLQIRLPDPAVALAALTHKSYVNEHRGESLQDNERLEFLGDAVIDLAVSHRLMERFPEAREGELSKIRAALVDEAGLARMARELDLGPLLRLGRGEALTGGRDKSSLLADAMEAVVAALYLSGGLGQVLALLDRFMGEAFARAAAGTLDRDYKTQFQELAQSRLRASPRYRVVAERGPDHSKVFDVELELRGEVVGRGEGRSKKDAEQAAAKRALEAINGRLAEERSAAAEAEPEAAPAAEPEAEPVQGAGPGAGVESDGEGEGEGGEAVSEPTPAVTFTSPSTPTSTEPAPKPETETETESETGPEPKLGRTRPPKRPAQRKPAVKPRAPRRKATTAARRNGARKRVTAAKRKRSPAR